MKNFMEILSFLEDVLGKTSAQMFDENMEELMYFIRSQALQNMEISEGKMKSRIKRLSEGIIAASVKKYLNDNYADDYGDVELNIGDSAVFDHNMKPIEAIDKIRDHQREMMSVMVSRGMMEFTKGRDLAKIIESRINEINIQPQHEPNPKDIDWTPIPIRYETNEDLEIKIMRLEKLLPNLSSEQAQELKDLYNKLRDCSKK